MTQIGIAVLTLVISAVAIFLGYLFDNFTERYGEETGGFLKLGGYLILLIMGIILFTSPISFADETITEETHDYFLYNNTPLINKSISVETKVYTSQDNTLSEFLAWVICLAGFSGFILTVIDLYQGRKRRSEDPDYFNEN